MKNPQSGFIELSLMGWVAVAGAVVVGLMYLRIQYLETKVALGEAFVTSVEVIGETARKAAKAKEREDLAKKEKADEELRKLRIANNALNQRLRDNAGRSVLPPTGTVAGVSETACFGRPELDAALQRFTGGAAELAIEGQQATDALNNAKRWGQGQ